MAIIKADLEGSVRLVEISADQLTVHHVRRHLGEVFDRPLLEGFELYYVADGEELVLIDSDEEFLAGLCENGSPFRVTIVPTTYGMHSLASCGASLLEGAEQLVSADEGESADEAELTVHSVLSAASAPPAAPLVQVDKLTEYVEDLDDDDDDSSSSSDEEEDEVVNSSDEDDDELEAAEAKPVDSKPLAAAAAPAPGGDVEPVAMMAASNDTDASSAVAPAPAAAADGKEGKKAKKARKAAEKQQSKQAKLQRTQLDDEQLLERATQRLRVLCPALADLQAEQLRVFMAALRFEFPKLVKAGVLKPAEVGRAAKHLRAHNVKHGKKPIDLPPACIQALRDRGLDASDETIKALVNAIRVQPRRFRKLGLIPASSSSDGEGAQRRRHGHGHGHGAHGQRGWYAWLVGEQQSEQQAPQYFSSDEEWAAHLPDNSDLLFEQAALRTDVEVSGAELQAFMRLLRIPFDRLRLAGLLSEMEVRGDGTGDEKLTSKLPKLHDGLAHKLKYFAPFFTEALQAHGVPLHPDVVQRLTALLHVRPRRFVKLGLADKASWVQQRDSFREERARQRSTGGVAGLGRWFASMLGVSGQRPHHGPHTPHQHGPHAHHGPHHGPHHLHHGPHHGPHPRHGPHQHGLHHGPHHGPHHLFHGPHHHGPHHHGPHHLFHGPHGSVHRAPPAAVPVGLAERETDRRFPTNASMAQIVPVEGRQNGKVVSSGVRFEQRWKVQNNHTHPWPAVVELIPDNDDAATLGVREGVRMSIPVLPEQSVDIAVNMEAPAAPGLYRPRFRLRDAQTALAFGQRLVAEVLVVDPSQPQQHEPQLPPRPQHGGMRRRMMMRGCADY